MALTTAVTGRFDNNDVRVEVNSKRQEPRYYRVPEHNADSFQREYKKNSSKMPWINTGLTLGAIAATIIPVSFLTNKIESKTIRMLLGVLAGLTGGIGSMYLGSEIEANSHKKLLHKYNAQEIDYTTSNFPV